MTIKKINTLFINFLIFTVLFPFTYLESKETCIPDFVLDAPTINVTPLNDTDKNSVYVLFDGSLSMQGFVNPSDQDTNLYVEVMDDLQQIAETIGNEITYLRFGRFVKTISDILLCWKQNKTTNLVPWFEQRYLVPISGNFSGSMV